MSIEIEEIQQEIIEIALDAPLWEDIGIDDQRIIYILHIFMEGIVVNSIQVSDFMETDRGTVYIEQVFSNAEIEELKRIENLGEVEWNEIITRGASDLEIKLFEIYIGERDD
jgi:hypothetical protein